MYLEGTGRPLYESPREGWLRVAAFAAVLSVLLTAALMGAAWWWGGKASEARREERRLRSEAQALALRLEGLKQGRDFFSLHRLLEHKIPKVQKLVETKLQDIEEEISRVEKDRGQLAAQLEEAVAKGAGKARRSRGAAAAAGLMALTGLLSGFALMARKKLLFLAAPFPALAAAVIFFWG